MQTSNKYVLDGQRLQCFQVILDGENRNMWFLFLVELNQKNKQTKMLNAYPHSAVRLHPIAQI